jgi:O-glycosyl hydrolase
MWKSMMPVPLTVKGKEATFALEAMTVDSQLRKQDIEGFCDNPYPPLPQS